MAEVFPQTSFWLFFDVPLTPTYENTFYFANATEQQNYFLTAFSNIVFSAQSYQRKSRGRIRVKASYGQVYNANYMVFVNMNPVHTVGTVPSYEQKRYYCFVTDVEYVNDAVCDIYYTLDVLQSFMFDWQFEQAMVERETTASDGLYEHLIDEGLPVGDYTFSGFTSMSFGSAGTPTPLNRTKPVVAATFNKEFQDTSDEGVQISQTIGTEGISGCILLRFSSAAECVQWLNTVPGEKQSGIIGIYLVPSIIDVAGHGGDTHVDSTITRNVVSLGSYTPQNKKLLAYPYNSMYVGSSDGSSMILDYRKFSSNSMRFKLVFSYTAPVTGKLIVTGYDGTSENNAVYSLPLPTVPTCSWSNDTYKAWTALNTGYMATSIAGSVIDGGLRVAGALLGLGAAGAFSGGVMPVDAAIGGTSIPVEASITTGGPDTAAIRNAAMNTAGGIVGDIKNIANNIITMHNAKIAPDSFNGSASGLADIFSAAYGFFYGQRCIRPEYARVLDNYFTMFGYKVMVIKTPSIHNRNRFTYVKTSNLDIKGRIPSVYRRQICDIFNAGIRWWVDRAHIGDYSYINAPLQ